MREPLGWVVAAPDLGLAVVGVDAPDVAGDVHPHVNNTYAFDHVRWSEERFYVTLLMGGAMGIVMLSFMWKMHKSTRINMGIVAGSLALMAVAVFLSRSQRFVDDRHMKGMIPHHSIAILTSENADLDDLRVCELANEIVQAKRREIAEMDWLIDDIAENGDATTAVEADVRAVPDFSAQEPGLTC